MFAVIAWSLAMALAKLPCQSLLESAPHETIAHMCLVPEVQGPFFEPAWHEYVAKRMAQMPEAKRPAAVPVHHKRKKRKHRR